MTLPLRIMLVFLAVLAAPATAQPRYDLAADAYAVFAKWMTTSCVGDEARALREALQRHRAELAPAFRRALADGPPRDELRVVRAAADSRYDKLAAFPLQDYRIEGATAQDLARFSRTTRQRFVDDQAQRYATGYRSNAIAGLAITGGAQDRALLARAASRRADPLATAAAEALKELDRR
jgi:hypothetical protein